MLVPAAKAAIAASASLAVAVAANDAASVYYIILLVVLVSGAITYIVAQVRDFRPNARLRRDNAELRKDNDDLQRRLDSADSELAKLRKSRDFEKALSSAVGAISDTRSEILHAIEAQASALEKVADAIKQNQGVK